ncbi:MAG: hypothetical protein ABL878_05030 [Burkholderiales bacterium]
MPSRRPAVDSYIVRIYRRSSEPGKEAAGLIERAGGGERRAFAGKEELWAFLSGGHSLPVNRPSRKRRARERP